MTLYLLHYRVCLKVQRLKFPVLSYAYGTFHRTIKTLNIQHRQCGSNLHPLALKSNLLTAKLSQPNVYIMANKLYSEQFSFESMAFFMCSMLTDSVNLLQLWCSEQNVETLNSNEPAKFVVLLLDHAETQLLWHHTTTEGSRYSKTSRWQEPKKHRIMLCSAAHVFRESVDSYTPCVACTPCFHKEKCLNIYPEKCKGIARVCKEEARQTAEAEGEDTVRPWRGITSMNCFWNRNGIFW